MNILVVDIDGVLNDIYSDSSIDEKKVMVLKELCNLFDAKVVIGSSRKPMYFHDINSYLKEKRENKYFKIMVEEDCVESKTIVDLYELFDRYNIELLGFTPNVSINSSLETVDSYKDFEIMYFLLNNPEVEHICILDDNDSTDLILLSDYLVEVDSKKGLTLDLCPKIEEALSKENRFKNLINDELQRKHQFRRNSK